MRKFFSPNQNNLHEEKVKYKHLYLIEKYEKS